jgi:threonine dehydratase
VVAVSMERGPAMYESVRAGRPVEVEELPTLADSLGGGIGLDNRCTFSMVRDLVDDYVLLSEAEIAEGMRYLFRDERLVVEGAAAVGVAAILAGKVDPRGLRTASIVTGNNIDMSTFVDVVGGRYEGVVSA